MGTHFLCCWFGFLACVYVCVSHFNPFHRPQNTSMADEAEFNVDEDDATPEEILAVPDALLEVPDDLMNVDASLLEKPDGICCCFRGACNKNE